MRYLQKTWVVCLLILGGCGGPTTPTPIPPPVPPAASTPTLIMIHDRGVWLLPGDTEEIAANARFSDGVTRDIPEAVWTSTNTAVFAIAPNGTRVRITAVAPGEARIRATVQGVSGEVPVRVASVTVPPDATVSPAAPPVVISEFRFEGPGGANDDFIELRNTSDAAVSLAGWSLAQSDGTGAVAPMGNIPAGVVLRPGCHFLFSSGNRRTATSEPILAADFLFGAVLASEGGVALLDASGRVVDQVATAAGSRYKEGMVLSPRAFTGGGSFSRLQDTNNNAADFAVVVTATRATLSDVCAAPAAGRRE